MKPSHVLLSLIAAFLLLMAACGKNADKQKNEKALSPDTNKKLHVVSSFTILSDIVREIGEGHVAVHNLVPPGTDPHEYVPLPGDIKAATDADLLVKNGFNLEGGENGWFAKLVRAAGQDESHVYTLTKGVQPMYLTSNKGRKGEINPHAFTDPVVGIKMAENVRDALIEVDPEHKKEYSENAASYIEMLKNMDAEYRAKIAKIPKKNRVLVTSERAFQYLAAEYGLKEGYIWAIDTEDNGNPRQIKSLLAFLKTHDVPVLFLETNVDKRPMKTISSESEIEIYGPIYSDEIGKPGAKVDTYKKYLQFNIDQIYNGLTTGSKN